MPKIKSRIPVIVGDVACVPLGGSSTGEYAIVDSCYGELVGRFNWHKHKKGYAVADTRVNGSRTTILMHHLIIGKSKNGGCVDHINHIKIDNRMGNLRHCSISANSLHRRSVRSNNISGFLGVVPSRTSGSWEARLRGKYVGTSKTKRGAIEMVAIKRSSEIFKGLESK